jgi:hypothetical protein
MPKLRMGANVTVFLLFFALATMEAVWKGNWILVAIFLLLGVLSLRADWLKRHRQPEEHG